MGNLVKIGGSRQHEPNQIKVTMILSDTNLQLRL